MSENNRKRKLRSMDLELMKKKMMLECLYRHETQDEGLTTKDTEDVCSEYDDSVKAVLATKELSNVKMVSRKAVLANVRFLTEKEKGKSKQKLSDEQKKLKVNLRNCGKGRYQSKKRVVWTSPIYIVKNIRMCILMRNWSRLTDLLLMLLKHNKSYIPYIKQVRIFYLSFPFCFFSSNIQFYIVVHLRLHCGTCFTCEGSVCFIICLTT